MKFKFIAAFSFFILFLGASILAPGLFAQSRGSSAATNAESSAASSDGQAPAAANFKGRYLWTEEFDGSTNEDGQVMELDSTVGYVFSRHFGVDAGIPIFFVRGSSTNPLGATTNTSQNGLGDAYLQLRLAFANPLLNYKTALTGTAPTGSKSDGFSTGHATYDWTNHFDHAFGRWVPFADAGIGNSIPENFVFQRSFSTFGRDAHFQAGTGFRITDWLGLSASAYDITTWGTQTIFSRIVSAGGSPVGRGGHGRVFELANQTTGGSSLASDHGFSAGVDLSPGSLLDFSAGYSHSVRYQLNTVSFGVGVNVSGILRRARAGA
ncbi:MAG TPA: hypothetical protein VKS20_05300 [Candidatus Acidoferrales bacterium]|nr:hypothetical protein [Candidatus Acidoferrales bacterium]